MGLASRLSPFLPKSCVEYHVLNVASTPKKSKKVFYNKEKQTTIKTQHFITIYQKDVVVFGIEIFVYIILYLDRTERVLFVSKADTTGTFNKELSNHVNIRIAEITREILSYLLNIPMSFYLDKVLVLNDTQSHATADGTSKNRKLLKILIKRLAVNKSLRIPLDNEKSRYRSEPFLYRGPIINKICLFTRPEPQYLFPYSNKNSGKHVLSGDQLLKWWCKIIDSVSASDFEDLDLKLLIPGAEARTIQRYFPSTNWKIGEIFSDNSTTNLAIHRIPLFPDDPKSRFIEHLIVENRIKKVKLRQFWLELSVRQEFRLGIVVGVIGVAGHLKKDNKVTDTSDLLKLKMKPLKKIKLHIVEQDYSKPEEQDSFQSISKTFYKLRLFESTWGTYERSMKRSIEVETQQPLQQPMMVIKRKKK